MQTVLRMTAISLAITLFFTSCATIVNGTMQPISISSYPADANIWVDCQFAGKTPLIIEMARKDNHIVRIELDGYEPYQIVLTKQMSRWVFGNIVFGGFFGLAIDVISGGVYRLTPEQVHAQFCAGEVVCSKKTNDSCIAVVLKADPSWEKIGNLTPAQ